MNPICSELVDYTTQSFILPLNMIVRLAVGDLNCSLTESLFPCAISLKFYYWDRGSSTHPLLSLIPTKLSACKSCLSWCYESNQNLLFFLHKVLSSNVHSFLPHFPELFCLFLQSWFSPKIMEPIVMQKICLFRTPTKYVNCINCISSTTLLPCKTINWKI